MKGEIIGAYKEFIIIERKELEVIENSAKTKLENNKENPLSEASIEAKAVLDMVVWLKENNIYNKGFELKL